jgi:two-component sensor histidine kinase
MYNKVKNFCIGQLLMETSSFHDKSRITLLFNLSFSVLILAILAGIISLIFRTYPVLVPAGGNVFLSLITLFFLRKNQFEVSAKIYFFALFILLFGNLIFNDGTMHLGSPFWIVLLNILVIYTFGSRWGALFLILSFLGFGYYILFVLDHTLDIIGSLPATTYYSTIYETLFALILLGYVISTILKASRESDKLLKEQNNELLSQNEAILVSDAEKTVLLKEVHHRVKNNLQVIVSLMRLQMREIKNEETAEMFKETMSRVMTMSMIHEKVYQSDELSRIDLERYFLDLSKDILQTYQTNNTAKFNPQFQLKSLDLESIVPLALIFNELFTNSIKHAFDCTENPEISLSIEKTKEGLVLLRYEDNGTWKQATTEGSFGLELIESLAEQLDAQVTFEKVPCTRYEFRF